jgi:hypothetical protein
MANIIIFVFAQKVLKYVYKTWNMDYRWQYGDYKHHFNFEYREYIESCPTHQALAISSRFIFQVFTIFSPLFLVLYSNFKYMFLIINHITFSKVLTLAQKLSEYRSPPLNSEFSWKRCWLYLSLLYFLMFYIYFYMYFKLHIYVSYYHSNHVWED